MKSAAAGLSKPFFNHNMLVSRYFFVNLLFCGCLLGLTGCSWISASTESSLLDYMDSARLGLNAQTNAAAYQPGDAVILTVDMIGKDSSDSSILMVPMLDAKSVTFYLRRKDGDEYGDVQVVQPVISQKEKLGAGVQLIPGQPIERSFIFTTLTFESGDYSLLPVYTYQDPPLPNDVGKAYAQPVFFTVAGENVSVHRYINGLMAEQDAIEKTLEHLGMPGARAQAQLILDEKGFYQWWVNAWPKDGASPRACFVNPYLGKVWKEAEPFAQEDKAGEVPFPADSRLIEQIKEQRGRE